jgi:adenine deaminase
MRHGTVASVSDPHEIANVLGEAVRTLSFQHAANSWARDFFCSVIAFLQSKVSGGPTI